MPNIAASLESDGAAFGPLLRRFRLAARLSQEQLAERARLSVVSVSALERGRRRAPYRETIRLLGEALLLTAGQRAELEIAAKRRLPGGPNQANDEPDGDDTEEMPAAQQPGVARRHNLPVSRTRLIGRERDVAALVGMLRSNRLVTLVGTGGIGKTRTALAAGEALVDETPAGVWFIDLAPLSNGSFVVAAVAHVLELKEPSNGDLRNVLLSYLKHKDVLLIFDNCEHVVADVAMLLDELLRGCARLKILATSRERLRINGEQAHRLPSLTVPARGAAMRMRAADAGQYAALTLFIERAQAIDGRFEIHDANAPAVAEICRLLDGIALAIELAAARSNILPPGALLEKLDERFRILTGGERFALPRHQTMLALIDWSYDLLTPREQRLFERLSVFAGGCDLTEASAVCGDEGDDEFTVLDVVMSLVEKSLLMTDVRGRDMRYRLLESSRMYGARKLREHGEAQHVARRHSQTYLALAEHLERERNTAPDAEWVARSEPELENWHAALIWSFGPAGDVLLGQRLVGALRPVWSSKGLAEGRRWIDVALDRATDGTPTEIIDRLHFAAASITFTFGEYEAALAQSIPLVNRFRAAGNEALAAYAEYFAGGSLVSMGRVTEGTPFLERALASARAQGNVRLTGLVLEDIGYATSLGPDPAQARVQLGEALKIWTMIGAKRNVLNGAVVLAENLFLCGETESAIELAVQTIEKLREMAFSRTLISALNNLAAYLNAADRFQEAVLVGRQALEIALETEAHVAQTWSVQHLAAAAALVPRSATPTQTLHDATRLIGYADARLLELGSPRTPPEQREYDRARTALAHALAPALMSELLAAGAGLSPERAVEIARLV